MEKLKEINVVLMKLKKLRSIIIPITQKGFNARHQCDPRTVRAEDLS